MGSGTRSARRGDPLRGRSRSAGDVHWGPVQLARWLVGRTTLHRGRRSFLTVGLAYVWPAVSASRFAGPALALTAGLVTTGVLFNATPAILYPQYPTQLRNPTFQLLLPLPFEGYVPYSLGYALRLRGLLSLLPTLLAVVGALALAFRSASDWQKDRRRALKVILGAILIFAVVGGAFALWARDLSPGERAAIQLVKGTWTPRRASATMSRTRSRSARSCRR